MNLCKWVFCAVGVIFLKSAGAKIVSTPGELSIQGEIIEAACALDSRSRELWVDFGEVSAGGVLDKSGSANTKSFQIMLTGCLLASKTYPNMPQQRANITFSTHQADSDSHLIALNGNASGFGILIKDHNDIPITLGQPSPDYYLVNGDNELHFTASLVPDNKPIKAGSFYANVNFFMDYL